MRFATLEGLLWAAVWVQGSRADDSEEQWVRAVALPQMSRRQDYQGGWPQALSGSKCADGLVQCNGIISNPSCCPSGSTCAGSGEQYCCPQGVTCQQYVKNFPQCAEPKNVLYMLDTRGNYFCCPVGEFGVLPLTGYGGFCQPDGAAVAASRIATKATEAKTTFQATTGTTRTTLVVATANGALTTITSVVTTGRVTLTVTSPKFDATQVAAGSDSNNGGSQTTTGSSPTSGSSSSNNNSNNSGGGGGGGSSISAGAIAGIVIGALAVVAMFLLAFVIYRRRKPTPVSHPSPSAGPGAAPDYSAYAPPPLQDKPETTNYPIPVGSKSPLPTHAAVSPTVGGQTPVQGPVGPHHGGYGGHGEAVEIPGQNTWEIGPGR